MNRQLIPFGCAGETLMGTLDHAAASGSTGLLLVSGGNEIRAGAWGGQARLSARLAREGVPVFRYDRRGVGDSGGANLGFRHSAPDIAAARAAFIAAAPHLRRVVAFGNCDAASALMLHAAAIGGIDALVLANPWTVDGDESGAGENGTLPVHSAAALRRHYLRRLTDPAQWLRLLTGKVRMTGLADSLATAARPQAGSALAGAMEQGLADFAGPVTILLAEGDRTAQLFRSHWSAGDPRIAGCASASHSFVDAQDWLFEKLRAACG